MKRLAHDLRARLSARLCARLSARLSAPLSARSGSTLVELLAALPIIGIVGALALILLIATERQARRSDATDSAVRELRHAAVILGAELRPLRPVDLVAWSDTSLEFQALVAIGIACDVRSSATSINLLPVADADPLDTHLVMPVQDGDRVRAMLAPGTVAGAPQPWETRVSSVSTSAACPGSMLRVSAGAGLQVALDDVRPAQVAEGSPVRITRRTRYNLYRAGDGLWYLGRTSRGRTIWDGVQPVAGPFTSAASRGLRITVRDSAGNALVAGPTPLAATVHVELRAARLGAITAADSSFVAVALRARNE